MRANLSKRIKVLKFNSEILAQTVKIQYLKDENPTLALQSGKIMASAWAASLDDLERDEFIQSFVYLIIDSFWRSVYKLEGKQKPLPALSSKIGVRKLDPAVVNLAHTLGIAASKLSIEQSTYLLGSLYSNLLSEHTRTEKGIFYTPPALVERLIKLVEAQQVDWASVRVLDPACGSGAFLVPIALRMADALRGESPDFIINHISTHLAGNEIDGFAAWLSQVFIELALKQTSNASDIELGALISVFDSLEVPRKIEEKFHVVIGNPPYGKIKLTEELRIRYAEGLYGHANLYGLFIQLGLNLTRSGGVLAYVTPTSFLAGEYFKNLRSFINRYSTPVSVDFVIARKGVFDEVLQETTLSVYRKSKLFQEDLTVCSLARASDARDFHFTGLGKFSLPPEGGPWIIPRDMNQASILNRLSNHGARLRDWGYEVSTGPLVWNRHKSQLQDLHSKNCFPLIWSECLTEKGLFSWKAARKNHKLYFDLQPNQAWLKTTNSCILLQRTTSKEQSKRLIAAILPRSFVKRHGGVVVENHLNIISANCIEPAVPIEVLNAILNSDIVDSLFRCISGSVAVSAYELENLPFPSIESISRLKTLVAQNASREQIELECHNLYFSR